MYHPFIIGKKVYLRGLEKDDLKSNYFQWTNDEEVTYYLERGLTPSHLELLEAEYLELIKNKNEIVFCVVDKESDQLIGLCGLHLISWVSRKAEFRVLIGEKDYWGKGYGTEVTELLTKYGFEKLNMNKIWLGVNAENIKGVKAYEKAGFVKEGVLRQEIFRNNVYCDAIRMSILRKEYEQQKK